MGAEGNQFALTHLLSWKIPNLARAFLTAGVVMTRMGGWRRENATVHQKLYTMC